MRRSFFLHTSSIQALAGVAKNVGFFASAPFVRANPPGNYVPSLSGFASASEGPVISS
jgi:hypothetical protein